MGDDSTRFIHYVRDHSKRKRNIFYNVQHDIDQTIDIWHDGCVHLLCKIIVDLLACIMNEQMLFLECADTCRLTKNSETSIQVSRK